MGKFEVDLCQVEQDGADADQICFVAMGWKSPMDYHLQIELSIYFLRQFHVLPYKWVNNSQISTWHWNTSCQISKFWKPKANLLLSLQMSPLKWIILWDIPHPFVLNHHWVYLNIMSKIDYYFAFLIVIEFNEIDTSMSIATTCLNNRFSIHMAQFCVNTFAVYRIILKTEKSHAHQSIMLNNLYFEKGKNIWYFFTFLIYTLYHYSPNDINNIIIYWRTNHKLRWFHFLQIKDEQ